MKGIMSLILLLIPGVLASDFESEVRIPQNPEKLWQTTFVFADPKPTDAREEQKKEDHNRSSEEFLQPERYNNTQKRHTHKRLVLFLQPLPDLYNLSDFSDEDEFSQSDDNFESAENVLPPQMDTVYYINTHNPGSVYEVAYHSQIQSY